MESRLMHPRVARNAAKMGFFPTDGGTLSGISRLLAHSDEAVTFLDPCCGNGDALMALADRQRYPFARRYGIELDEQRANTARTQLDVLLHGDALASHVTPQSVDVLFLNPPYADELRDQESRDRAGRLEDRFLSRFFPALCNGGILIYIVPKARFHRHCQRWLLTRFTDVRVHEAATDQFRQLVITGRKAGGIQAIDNAVLKQFAAWQDGEAPWPQLPATTVACYTPAANDRELRMHSVDLDAEGVAALIREEHGLWRDFRKHFCRDDEHADIRPLHDLTDWHTSLLIASGVVSGLVDNGERTLLVRGRTVKNKIVKIKTDEEGEAVSEEHRDSFDTVIKAIDLTADAPSYGQVFIIR